MTEDPAGFTLAKVAQRAGVSAATLVERFGSKEALFLRSLIDRLAEALDAVLDAWAPTEAHQ